MSEKNIGSRADDDIRPTRSDDRLSVLDGLRGMALFGILLANLCSFMGYSTLRSDEITALPNSELFTLFLIDWLIEGKFYSVFSMLFGMGFALQFERMQDRQVYFRSYWFRRMRLLLSFGLIHMLFIWHGDILTLYSLLGMVLLVLSGMSVSRMRGAVVALLISPILLHVIVMITQDAAFWRASAEIISGWQLSLGYAGKSLLELRTSSEPVEVFFINILKAAGRPMSYVQTGRIFQVLGLFMLGVLIMRVWGAHIRAGKLIPKKYWLLPGCVGLVCSFGYAAIKSMIGSPYALDTTGLVQAVLYHVSAPSMAVGIAGLFYHSWHRGNVSKALSGLVTLGRMALTNYIMQNTLAVLLFFGYGFGLMRQLPFWSIPLNAAFIVLFQIWFSRFWLARFRQGPLEALWKRLAYSST